MKVYVIWDPLLERVLCVHSKKNKECKHCKPIRKERYDTIGAYHLQSKKCKVK